MNIFLPLTAALAGAERVLVAREAMYPPMALLRAQVASASTALAANGIGWTSLGADTSRYFGPTRRLLIEGQRTNLNSGARLPGQSGWANTNVTVAAITGPGGLEGDAATLTEAATSASFFTSSPNTSYTAGVTYAFSAVLRAGSCGTVQFVPPSAAFGFSAFANVDLQNGVLGSGSAVVSAGIGGAVGGWRFCRASFTATASATAHTGAIVMTNSASAARIPTFLGTGRTLDVAWAGCEVGPFASTPILPAVGAPAVSTRGSDLVSAPLAALGIGGPCTILWSGVIPHASPASAPQTIIQLDASTDASRYMLRVEAGGGSVSLSRVDGGVAASIAAGTMTPGTAFRAGLSINGTGRAAASFNGAATVAVTGGPTSGITTLRLGNTVGNSAPMFGETGALAVLPFGMSDAGLAARVGAFQV
jgi:hypothetical protein